jgi:hypothetical protein
MTCSPEAKVNLLEDAVDASAGNLPCFKIETPTATYYLEKEGAGLSSMIARDGTDWIDFHPEPGSGSGGEYRGFPNAVHQQDGSFFHPKNEGTEPSVLEVVGNSGENVSIKAVSGNGNWEALWEFYPTHCTFTMQKMAPGYAYWILYEGVPGGTYDDTDWYMTSDQEEKSPLTVNYEKDIPDPEWIAFGDPDHNRSIVLYHHEDDNQIDKFYQMRKEMTVFGFGRDGMKKLMNTVPQQFSIAFVPSTDHDDIAAFVSDKLSL